ncbi:DUF1642 domain-containing protein [Listeria cossartiae]|uniref:DUF1642 domain-containing protein n=1 Tax=Listeria cossartiae TaxID=2838249 RepID=UPI001F3452C0|nr:DUF1642 domain-containing protein [Listeria cossartiae]
MRVYHTETQEDFNALMEKLEREGCMWRNGDSPLEYNSSWNYFCKNTVVYDRNKKITIGSINSVQGVVPIEKYSKSNNSKFPVVPQFVADWYENHKDNLEYSIWEYIYDWDDQDRESDFYDFMNYGHNRAIETLIKMKDGYEIEKEQLYYVKLITNSLGYLNMRYDGGRSVNSSVQNDIFKTQFTESEIKEMDERYWQFAVPVDEVTG